MSDETRDLVSHYGKELVKTGLRVLESEFASPEEFRDALVGELQSYYQLILEDVPEDEN